LTPLHRASYLGHVEVVKLLLKAGANIEARSKVSVCYCEIVENLNSISMALLRSTMLVWEVLSRSSGYCSREGLISSAKVR
jgi:ankyrin repeat protein